MSQTGTPTEFLKLGITEPDDTLNVLVDLNGQWQKIDTGVKNVDTKANTNASGITALNTAVQDNTENITNILETNVNQQNSIDTLQSKVATLEQDDTDYGTRITAVEAGVQENSELINDLEVDLSGVKTEIGTVPSGSTVQGQVDGLDTRVTTLETEVGTVPSGQTVQGQITGLSGQVNSGNIPFRFSVDGGGNYGYLKADDSFVPFSSGDPHWHELDTTLYRTTNAYSFATGYKDYQTQGSPHYGKIHDFIHDVDYSLPDNHYNLIIGNVVYDYGSNPIKSYLITNNGLTTINNLLACAIYNCKLGHTYYLTHSNNSYQFNTVDVDGNSVGLPINFTLRGKSTSPIAFSNYALYYTYNNTHYKLSFDSQAGTATESQDTDTSNKYHYNNYLINGGVNDVCYYTTTTGIYSSHDVTNTVVFNVEPEGSFFIKVGVNTNTYKYYYYI